MLSRFGCTATVVALLALSTNLTAQDEAESVKGVKDFSPLRQGSIRVNSSVSKAELAKQRVLDALRAVKPKSDLLPSNNVVRGQRAGDTRQGGIAGDPITNCNDGDCEVGILECNGAVVEAEFPQTTCIVERGAQGGGGPERLIEMYTLEITEPAEVTIEMFSDPIDTYLYVYNEECDLITYNDDTGSTDLSRVVVNVPEPTTLIVGCSSWGEAPGVPEGYTLTATCGERSTPICETAECLIDTSLVCDADPIAATFPQTACMTTRDREADIYPFELTEAGLVTIRMESVPIDTFLHLMDADCNQIALNDDAAPGNYDLSLITVDLDAGEYFVICSAYGPAESGDYTVSVSCDSGPFDLCTDCVVGEIACDDSVTAVLDPENARCTRNGNAYMDLYSFEVDETTDVVISLEGNLTPEDGNLDTYLTLRAEDCATEVAFDDDGGEGLNSLLTLNLEAGIYHVGASSFGAAAVGDYTLSISCPNLSTCNECVVGAAVCGEPTAGDLSEGDCTLADGSFTDTYSLEIPVETNLSLALSSESFDTVLALLNDRCEVVASNDDCGDGTNSCLDLAGLSPGNYFVLVNSANFDESGAYELTVDCDVPSVCRDCSIVGAAECNGTVEGELTEEDCSFGGDFIDLYEFAHAGGPLTVEMSSPPAEGGFDTYLYLYRAEDCTEVARNDDCTPGDFRLSCVSTDLPAGDYLIGLSTFSAGATGPYSLTVTVEDCEPIGGGFIRGDADANAVLDLTDGVFILNFLFLGGAAPTCLKAADANDNGSVDLAGAVSIFNFLFLGGPPPPAPYPECGTDDSELSCESFAPCE